PPPARCRDASARTTTGNAGVRGSEPLSTGDAVGVVTRWTVDCGSETLVGEEVGVTGPGPAGAVVRVVFADGQVAQQLVLPATPRFTIPAAARACDVAGAYGRLGIEHILGGPDH